MRKLKKGISLIMVTAMLLSLLSLNVSAAAALRVSEGTSINLAYNQSSFEVTVSLDDVGYSFASAAFSVSYDNTYLTLTNVNITAQGTRVNYDDADGNRVIGVANGENILSGGELATLRFTYTGTSSNSAAITLSQGEIVTVTSAREGEVSSVDVSGIITVTITKAAAPSGDGNAGDSNNSSDNTSNSTDDSSSNSSSSSSSSSSTTGNDTQSSDLNVTIAEEENPLGAPVVSAGGIELSYDGNGYISGFPDGTVRPDDELTRGQLAVMLYQLVTNKDIEGDIVPQFSDLNGDEYYCEAIMFFASNGILSGYPDGTFRADDNITRAESATVLSRFVSDVSENDEITFSDISGHWAENNILLLAEAGKISGYPDGSFRPDSTITRAEIITMINKILSVNSSSILLEKENTFTDLDQSHWAYAEVLAVTKTNK